ncbi:hypothetical protein Hanom_Chr16g01441041 [Helianthus anomalus]
MCVIRLVLYFFSYVHFGHFIHFIKSFSYSSKNLNVSKSYSYQLHLPNIP